LKKTGHGEFGLYIVETASPVFDTYQRNNANLSWKDTSWTDGSCRQTQPRSPRRSSARQRLTEVCESSAVQSNDSSLAHDRHQFVEVRDSLRRQKVLVRVSAHLVFTPSASENIEKRSRRAPQK